MSPGTEIRELPPRISRRNVLQAGAVGLGRCDSLLTASAAAAPKVATPRKSVIFVF